MQSEQRNVAAAVQETASMEALLSQLVAAEESAGESLPVTSPRVASREAQLLPLLDAEVRRQLPRAAARLAGFSDADELLPLALDAAPVQKRMRELDEELGPPRVRLRSHRPEHRHLWCAVPSKCYRVHELTLYPERLRVLPFRATEEASSAEQTSRGGYSSDTKMEKHDAEEDFCVAHTHVCEFTCAVSSSLATQEIWCLLPCQPLSALIDAVWCDEAQFRPHDAPETCPFVRVADTFYLCPGEGSDGRAYLSCLARLHEQFPAATFADATVTAVGDLTLSIGQKCSLEHLDSCVHYFWLSGVYPLGPQSVTQRCAFPHRTAALSRVPLRCAACRQRAATIAQHDRSGQRPLLFCASCYEQLLSEQQNEQRATEDSGVILLPDMASVLSNGQYFSATVAPHR